MKLKYQSFMPESNKISKSISTKKNPPNNRGTTLKNHIQKTNLKTMSASFLLLKETKFPFCAAMSAKFIALPVSHHAV